MQAPNKYLQQLPSAEWRRLDQFLRDFEAAHSSGRRPAIEDFLPAGEGHRLATLIELIHIDLEWRLKQGEPVRVESYLQQFPEVRDDPELALALIVAEYQWRCSREPSLTALEYEQRFPQYRDDLAKQLTPLTDPWKTVASAAPQGGQARAAPMPNYEILGELGRGGMGVVYKARHVQLNRIVALKMILADHHAGAQHRLRFRAEAEAVARLKHPHIVQIYEIGEADGRPFFSLEFVEGGSLEKQLKLSLLPPRQAAELVETLARAMHYAHQHNIIHRDLKPANILLATASAATGSANWQPKIADFGLAKRLDTDVGQTHSGAIVGTPPYMAPEQAAGQTHAIGPATDIYALGAVLYDVLIGRPPFRAATALETIRQVIAEEPIPLRRLQPNVPRDLETICLKCLHKEPARRYATAEALADDLRRFVNREPIAARRTPGWERLAKWARRKPALASAFALLGLAACALAAFVTLYFLYISQQAESLRQQLVTQDKGHLLYSQALVHCENGDLEQGRLELGQADAALDAQPGLDARELREQIQQLRDKIDRKLRAQQLALQFWPAYHDAIFFSLPFPGLEIPEKRGNILKAVQTALGSYGWQADARSAEQALARFEEDRAHQPAGIHGRLAGGCYELLLIWADAEASPTLEPAAPDERRRQAEKALALLDCAQRLGQRYGLNSQTFHWRKAHYLAQSKGMVPDAAALQKTLPERPTSRLDWFHAGMEHYRRHDLNEALAAFDKILEEQPGDFWARYFKALCYLNRRGWSDAREQLSLCLQQRPDFLWPRLLRGFAHSAEGAAHEESKTQLARYAFAEAQKDLDVVLERLQDPLAQYIGLENRGVLFVRQKRWADAVKDLRRAVALRPGAFQGHVNLAQALAGLGEPKAALAAMDQAVILAPKLALVYRSRAKLHLEQQDLALARADFEEAITREPPDSKSEELAQNLVELGKLDQREEKYSEALKHYDRALQIKPGLWLVQRVRAEALLALHRSKEAGQALDAYLQAHQTRKLPAPAEAYHARGLIHAEAGQLSQAIELYTLALGHNPKAPAVIRCQRGWAHLFLDATSLALRDFEACLQAPSKTATDALIGRGCARVRMKELDKALQDARNAEANSELSDRLCYNLARLYAQAILHLETEEKTARSGLDKRQRQQLVLCKAKAIDCLRRTLELLPKERRISFWQDQVQVDPAFIALRGSVPYLQLATHYSGK